MHKFLPTFSYVLLLTLITFSQNSVAQTLDDSEKYHWTAVRYWVEVNNGTRVNTGLTTDDHTLLNRLNNNGGYLYTKPVANGEIDTVSVWGYLAEMGLGIMNNWDTADAQLYLQLTASTARYYGSGSSGLKLYSGSPGKYGQGRLLNKNSLIPTYPNNAVLPFNFNAAYAYFCAVRAKMHKKLYNSTAQYEQSLAFYVYQYLHSQMIKIPNPKYVAGQTIPGSIYPQPTTLTSWKYSELRANGTADDMSHGGFAARALAFGASENFVWVWWANSLFYYSAPMMDAYEPGFINMTGSADTDTLKGLFYWHLPYNP